MKGKDDDSGVGCAIVVAFASMAIGIGAIFGAGYGWVTFGILVLIITIAGASKP